MSIIAVMGASGNTGKLVATLLLKAGHTVRALGRTAAHIKPLVDQGAIACIGDASNVDFLTNSFQGANAVYALIPGNMKASNFPAYQDQIGEAITKAVQKSGIRNVVFLSSVGADLPAGNGPVAGLHRQENRLRALPNINVLILRPSYFFENHLGNLGMIKQQGINGGAMDPHVAFPQIATKDIAQVAADALQGLTFSGFSVRELLGQRDLTMQEVTKIIGKKIGKPDLQYIQLPYDQFTQAMTQMGISESVAKLYAEMSKAFNEGKIKTQEGRKAQNTTPTDFEHFANQLASTYQNLS